MPLPRRRSTGGRCRVSVFQTGARSGFSYSFTGAPTGDLTQGLAVHDLARVRSNLARRRSFERNFRTECISHRVLDGRTTASSGQRPWRQWWPKHINHDITLFKNFRMSGTRNLQIRVEMYNPFNMNQFTTIDTSAQFDYATGRQTDTNFGRATNTRGDSSRVIQLGARLTF
jgi:hypothetical protein